MIHIDIHRISRWFFIVFVFMVFVSCRSGKGSLEGIITDAFTKIPIPGAEIIIDGKVQKVRTDSSGYFLIQNLPSDTVRVMFKKPGYQTKAVMDLELYDTLNTYMETDLKPFVDWICSDTMTIKTVSVNGLEIYFTDEKIQGQPDSVTGLSYKERSMGSKEIIASKAMSYDLLPVKRKIMERQTEEWLKQADYDMDTADYMYKGGRYIYAVFMCHLSVEKALKGLYFEQLRKIPPKSHNPVYLLN